MEIKELIRKAGIRSNRKDINLSGFTEECSQWLTSSHNAVRELRKLRKLGEKLLSTKNSFRIPSSIC